MPDPSQSHSVLGFVVCWSKWGSENDTHCAGAGLEASVLVGSVVCQCSGQGQQQGPITLAQPIEDLEESSLLDPWTINLGGFWCLRFTFAEVEELIEFETQRIRPLLNGFNGGNRVPAFNPGYVTP